MAKDEVVWVFACRFWVRYRVMRKVFAWQRSMLKYTGSIVHARLKRMILVGCVQYSACGTGTTDRSSGMTDYGVHQSHFVASHGGSVPKKFVSPTCAYWTAWKEDERWPRTKEQRAGLARTRNFVQTIEQLANSHKLALRYSTRVQSYRRRLGAACSFGIGGRSNVDCQKPNNGSGSQAWACIKRSWRKDIASRSWRSAASICTMSRFATMSGSEYSL